MLKESIAFAFHRELRGSVALIKVCLPHDPHSRVPCEVFWQGWPYPRLVSCAQARTRVAVLGRYDAGRTRSSLQELRLWIPEVLCVSLDNISTCLRLHTLENGSVLSFESPFLALAADRFVQPAFGLATPAIANRLAN